MNGLYAIFAKEWSHLWREPFTLLFALIVPTIELLIFGFAIDVTVRNIDTVVLDHDGRDESRRLVETFANTRTFRIVARVRSQHEFDRALAAGAAKVGLIIPPDYSDRLVRQQATHVQVLIDGSNANVATAALNAANLVGLSECLRIARPFVEQVRPLPAREPAAGFGPPIQMRPRILFNPDLISARFFVPGLVGLSMQLVTLFLTAFTIVRERERGTLEQLFVTPVAPAGLLLGKLLPYGVLGLIETVVVLLLMVFVFRVPIHGSVLLLLGLAPLFLLAGLGLGLFISTLADTQVTALQVSFAVMMPSILLSGFLFPREEMPTPIYWLSFAIPLTHFLEILRGVVIRGSDLRDLFPHIVNLTMCMAVILALSVLRFRKRLD